MHKKIIAVSATHGCFGVDTLVRMFDGTTRKVQDLRVGDLLMGDDSTPRKVLVLRRGEEELFEFEYNDGIKHVYNKSHELILQFSQTKSAITAGDEVVTTVEDYLKFGKNKKRILCKFNAPITRSTVKNLPVPPYILGAWLGDGSSLSTRITNIDECVLDAISRYVEDNHLQLSQHEDISFGIVTPRGQANPFLVALQKYSLVGNKHIPLDYFNTSVENRLELLAGLLDTDGTLNNNCRYAITQKYKKLAYDIYYLARSCGLHATINSVVKVCTNSTRVVRAEGIYYDICITRSIHNIPCKIPRKKAKLNSKSQRKTTRVGVRSVTSLGVGKYYGFTLDGNNRFLHADSTVLKNCGKTTMVYGLAAHLKKLGKNVVVLNELARECPFEINQDGEDRTQIWLIVEQIKRELELMDRYDYVIADRSLFDAYAYATFLDDGTWKFKELWPYMVAHAKTYYKRIYLLDPTSFKHNVEDGVRDTDEHFRMAVHRILSTLLHNSDAWYRHITKETDVFSEYS